MHFLFEVMKTQFFLLPGRCSSCSVGFALLRGVVRSPRLLLSFQSSRIRSNTVKLRWFAVARCNKYAWYKPRLRSRWVRIN